MTASDDDLLEREGVRSWFAALGREEGLSDSVILKLWTEGKTADDIRIARHITSIAREASVQGVSDSDLIALIESHAPLDSAAQVIGAGAGVQDVVRWWDACDLPLTTCALLLSMGLSARDIDRIHASGIPLGLAAKVMSVRGVTLDQLEAIHSAGLAGPDAASALARGVPFADMLTWGKAGLDLYRIAAGYPVIDQEADAKVRETFAVLVSDGLNPSEALKSARALTGIRAVNVTSPRAVETPTSRSL